MSAYYECDKETTMNFDLNALTNIAKMLGGMQNAGAPTPSDADIKPSNTPKPFDKSKVDNLHKNSSFTAQNGLGDKIDAYSFASEKENDAQNSQKPSSPFDSILNLMSKKKDFEKMMPALANVFSKRPQTTEDAKTQPIERDKDGKTAQTTPPNASKQKENGKAEDIFGPIGFAGYTALCAVNRLFFAMKN